MAKLRIEAGAPPRDVALSDPFRIGRDEGNELLLDDAGISRRHCRLEREGDLWILEDLKSANGTYRNEERIDRVRIDDGDKIRIGGVVMVFLGDESTNLRSRAVNAATTSFLLAFVSGEKVGERIPLGGTRIAVGRKPGNDVILKDGKVSGAHCEVVVEAGRPVLRDLGSTNGTFLEGKRIDEIVLSHGDRVAIGDSEFVLVDVTKPLPNLEAKRPEDATRTLIDAPAVNPTGRTLPSRAAPKKSPLAAIGLLLLLVAAGGAGWFWWQVQRKSAAVAAAPAPAGNLLGERWSFESVAGEPEPSQAWEILGGAAHGFTVSLRAHSGQQAYQGEPAGAEAVARLRDPIEISGRRYRATAFARASGDAVAILAAEFTKKDAPDFRVRVPIGSARGDTWQTIDAELAPPTGADRLAIVLVACGTGSAAFDDVGVFEAGIAAPETKTVNQFEFEHTGSAVLVRRGGTDMFRVLPTEFESPPPTDANSTDAPAAPLPHDVGLFLDAHQGSAGGAVGLVAGKSADFASSLESDDKSATVRVQWQNAPQGAITAVRLPIEVLAGLTDEPIGVVHERKIEPYQDSFESADVAGLVLGKPSARVRCTFTPAVRVVGRRDGDRFRIELAAPPLSGSLTIRMQVDFVAEKTAAGELLGKARDAEAKGALGEALTVLDQIQNEYPFDEAILTEAATRSERILKLRDQRAATVAQAIDRAAFLKSRSAYLDAEKEAADAERAFAGTPAAEQFKQQQADLARDRETTARSAEERAAQALLRRMRTAKHQDPPRTRVAQEIGDFLKQRYPWSDAAKAAEQEGKGP